MPRGGGSRGGGRSHGFHRHHIRRHNRHTHSRAGGDGPIQLEQLGIAIALFVIIMLIISLFTSKDEGHHFCSPGDSRLVNFSRTCRYLTVKDNSVKTRASLYLVTEEPPLTHWNSFAIDLSPLTVGGMRFEYWQYHLYPGSNFSLTACSPNRGSSHFYAIKGNWKFKKWIKGRKVPNEQYIHISNSCADKHEFYYTSEEENEYFFVFYNQLTTSVNITVHMNFERWEYSPPPSDADIPTCYVPLTGTCSLEIPYALNYRALIMTDIPEDVNWEETVDVSWSCDSRASNYLFLVSNMIPVNGLVFAVAVVALATYFLWRWRHPTVVISPPASFIPPISSDSSNVN